MNKKVYLELYKELLKIRYVEEEIALRYKNGFMRCPTHLSIGQEAVSVGVSAHAKKTDCVLSTHRCHAHYLAKGGDVRAMIAEIYGLPSGCAKGYGGSMHLVDTSVNFLGSTPIVGNSIPVATGVAFAEKMKKSSVVTISYFGEAATEEGSFHESLNFASLQTLPILYIVERNFYSVYTPMAPRQSIKRSITALANAYGIPAFSGDGNNVLEVWKLTQKAMQHIRKKKGPMLLLFDTYRHREHCGPNFDNNIGYRTEEEFKKWLKKDPIVQFEKYLTHTRVVDNKIADAIKTTLHKKIVALFDDVEEELSRYTE